MSVMTETGTEFVDRVSRVAESLEFAFPEARVTQVTGQHPTEQRFVKLAGLTEEHRRKVYLQYGLRAVPSGVDILVEVIRRSDA